MTFTGIDFRVDGKMVNNDLTGCSGLYDRSRSSGTQLFQCPIQVPVGKITALTIRYSASVDVLINDTVNGIYTDPSKANGFATAPDSGTGMKAGGQPQAARELNLKGGNHFL